MKKPLWKFIDDKGTFLSDTAYEINTLYFPLCNNYPIMSSLSPNLRGDIKVNFNSFLLEPVSRISLVNSKSSRNFWIYISNTAKPKIWSAAGVSKDLETINEDKVKLQAGLLWHKLTRENKKIGLKTIITSFIPASKDPVEIMHIQITNISSSPVKFFPTLAIPLFARSANNLHDHRQVTSLLCRIKREPAGIIVTPALLFDETGHKTNLTSYFVLGIDGKSNYPQYIYPTQEEFRGESSDLEAPEAIFKNIIPNKKLKLQGKEPMAGLRFKNKLLKPNERCSYTILLGITNEKVKINSIFKKFNTPDKIKHSLNTTKSYWQNLSSNNSVNTASIKFDNWFRWVNIQPALRKIFGCSFLPDFDYGKGGRGWRDLWQDCLSLTLSSPQEVRQLLIDNFSGVRIDGSNATIIGQKRSEFIADRNNITRVWMDHGVWPLITTLLYIHQTGDIKILAEETSYFRDPQLCRGGEIDRNWSPEYGKELKTRRGKIYKGTILEHILVQNLVQFFNVGPHNHIRLEGADWNDGLDMAREFGESVAFTTAYAQNLNSLYEILERGGLENIVLLKEIAMLADSIGPGYIDYSLIGQKQKILKDYFQAVKYEVSGEKISVPCGKLKDDLKKKADWITSYTRENEWLKTGFFNGYYDNNKERVEGKINNLLRMTLTGQVFPIMSGTATLEQIKQTFKNCKKYLQDKKFKGFRLNTDFKQAQPALGRAFCFVYGEKENGAIFNHMAVMFSYALYKRGFAKEGYEVLNSIYEMAQDTLRSKIYPCIPEYFNAEGRGMYSYLTGSASWFIFTLLTQAFGIRGEYGDLLIEPKLTKEQFKTSDTISFTTSFAGRIIEVKFINSRKKDFKRYLIRKVIVNGKIISKSALGHVLLRTGTPSILIPRGEFLELTDDTGNIIEIILG